MRVQWVRLFSIASVSAGFVLLSFCSSSKAQQTLNRNEARKQCNSYDANERLIGCTVVINAKGFGSRFEVATAYDGRCWAFNDLQQYERGLADCKAAVNLAPQYYYGHLNIANSLIGLGQISNGIAEFTKAITLKPSRPHAYWGRGRAFASLGNKDLARKDFEYLLSIQPTNEEVREAIAALDSPPPTQEVRPAPTARNPAPAPKADTAASSGTGFYVSVSGHVLTNYHVIDGCQTASIFRSGFSPIGARIVAADTKNDLALLKSDSSIKPIPPLRTGDDSRIMQVSTPVQPGNSGIIVSKLNAIILAQVTQDMAPERELCDQSQHCGKLLGGE
jgi:tetratricopeptide (TPR) repeat protein